MRYTLSQDRQTDVVFLIVWALSPMHPSKNNQNQNCAVQMIWDCMGRITLLSLGELWVAVEVEECFIWRFLGQVKTNCQYQQIRWSATVQWLSAGTRNDESWDMVGNFYQRPFHALKRVQQCGGMTIWMDDRPKSASTNRHRRTHVNRDQNTLNCLKSSDADHGWSYWNHITRVE